MAAWFYAQLNGVTSPPVYTGEWHGNEESGNTVVTVMTFCGNDIQRKNSKVWTENMYVAAELWLLCWTDVFTTAPLSQNKKTAFKMLSEEK